MVEFYSFYDAVVTDSNFPNESFFGLKVNCPQLFGSDTFEEWILPFGMFLNSEGGIINMPKVGDFICLVCQNGDIENVFWTFGKYNQSTISDKLKENKENLVLCQKNTIFILNGEDEKITLQNNNTKLEILKEKITLQNNNTKLEILKEKITLLANGFELTLEGGKIKIANSSTNLKEVLEGILNYSNEMMLIVAALGTPTNALANPTNKVPYNQIKNKIGDLTA